MKTLFFSMLFVAPVFADETLTETAPPAAKVERYELKNRSRFTLERETRAPFWPIGWMKSKPGASLPTRLTTTGAAAPKQKFEIQPEHFSVTSVLVGKPALATINGRSFAEGELLPVIAGNDRLRVVLKAVRDGGVWLEHEARQIYVPIRRLEVEANRQTEQQPQSAEFSIRIGASVEKTPEAAAENGRK